MGWAALLYINDALSLILFPSITAWLVSIAAPFPAISILMIVLDKCQMKSLENINILIKMKELLFEKNMFLKKKYHLKQNKFF